MYYSDKMRVIRFDMFSLKAKAIATAPAPIKLLEVGPDKTVYVGCGASVYVLRENEAGASKCPMHQ